MLVGSWTSRDAWGWFSFLFCYHAFGKMSAQVVVFDACNCDFLCALGESHKVLYHWCCCFYWFCCVVETCDIAKETIWCSICFGCCFIFAKYAWLVGVSTTMLSLLVRKPFWVDDGYTFPGFLLLLWGEGLETFFDMAFFCCHTCALAVRLHRTTCKSRLLWLWSHFCQICKAHQFGLGKICFGLVVVFVAWLQ